jgi:Flp pilus assembly protein TadG
MYKVFSKIGFPKSKRQANRGATIVEFAIILPLLLLLVFGLIEFGLILYNQHVITNACREAARAGVQLASPPGTTQSPNRYTKAQIVDVVNNYCGNYLVSFGSNSNQPPTTKVYRIDKDNPASDLLLNNTDPGCSLSDTLRKSLRVDVTYPYSFLVVPQILSGLFSNSLFPNSRTLKATTTMVCE